MNREPVSISTLMTPVSTPTAAKAPLHADRPVAIGDGGGFDLSAPEARTTRTPHDPMERQSSCATARRSNSHAPPQAGFTYAHHPTTVTDPDGPIRCRRDTRDVDPRGRHPIWLPWRGRRVPLPTSVGCLLYHLSFRGQWKRKSSAARLASCTLFKTMLFVASTSMRTSEPTWCMAAWTCAKVA